VVEAAARISKIHETRRKKNFAEEWYQKVVSIQKNLARKGEVVGVGFAAEAKLKLVRKIYEEFASIRIPGGSAQGAAVQRKLSVLNRLKEELKQVIIYDDGFQIVAALNLQGQALHQMYRSLVEAPIPKGLSAEEEKTYREGVETQIAAPFKVQALEVLDSAVERGHEMQAYNDDLVAATKTLASLRGDRTKDIDPRVKVTTLTDQMGLE
jgi:cellulose synthase operon protein C